MKRHVICAAAVLAAVPGAAAAKGVEKAELCGAQRCVALDGARGSHALLQGGPIVGRPARPVPHYRVEFGIGDGSGRVMDTIVLDWVPELGLVKGTGHRGDAMWQRISTSEQKMLRRAARGLAPLPASRLDLAGPAVRPVAARVSETVSGAQIARAAAAAGSAGGGLPAWLLAGAAALLGALGWRVRRGALARARRAEGVDPAAWQSSPTRR